MASSPRSPSARLRHRLSPGTLLVLALAYVPALLTAPGIVAADTKQYLYLDPASFLARARSLWDTSQFGGYVTHQQVGYLWPMGPWFWASHALGVPVWVAQRLWVGTLIALATLGARWFARRLGLPPGGAFVAALAYGFSPYLLTYVSRTSVLLLPWAALGWAMVLTLDALGEGGWRAPAGLGLVFTTVGSVNATAVVLVGLGPLVLALDAVLARRVAVGRALRAGARVATCCAATSLWWIVALVVEGRFGAAVLRYSETISAVATTSSSTEVVRGLGYWLFYGSLADGPWNDAAPAYLTNPALIALTMALAVLGLVGLTLLRWPPRRALLWQLAIGLVVAVGAHSPRSPYGRLLGGRFARTTLALALRSSTRAVPLVVLSLACGIGAAVTAIGAARPRLARPVAAGAGVLVLLQLPALATGGYVDGLLRRPSSVPVSWQQAADELERRGGGRILELPGQEFAAYRWGTTTDPILPGLTSRGLLTRDLLPLGGDQRMNLLYALDQRFQDGIVEPASIAPVARLLGATDIVARLDANWERYRTPPPDDAWRALDGAPGLTTPTVFGPASGSSSGAVPGAVAVLGVERTPPTPRVEPISGATIIAGDGDGVVDASAAGLLDGTSPVVYAADLSAAGDRPAGGTDQATVDGARALVVTDTNRAAARQWRGTQDVVGFTEDGTGGDVVRDEADARLAPFGDHPATSAQTVAVQRGTWTATASAYGEPSAYRPEDRAFHAVDGDAGTAWRVADRADPVGQSLQLRSASAVEVDGVRLVQVGARANRHVTAVTIETDRQRRTVSLDPSSLTSAGQFVELGRAPTSRVTVTVAATDVPTPPSFFGLDAVGFAEVTVSSPGAPPAAPTVERVVLPRFLDPATEAPAADVDVVLTRQRVDPTNRWRNDPERLLEREFRLPAGDVSLAVTARLDARAPDGALGELVGITNAPAASSSLTGVLAARPWAAADGDAATAWTSGAGDVVGAWWQAPLAAGAAVDALALRLVDDARHSVPTAVRVAIGASVDELPLPAAGADGVVRLALPAARHGDAVRIEVTDAVVRTAIDRRYGEEVPLPVALAEVEAPGLSRASLAGDIDSGCRADLLAVDGSPVPLRVRGTVRAAFDQQPLTVERCGTEGARTAWATGPDHVVTSGVGSDLGIDIDRVVLSVARTASAGAGRRGAAPRPTAATVVSGGSVTDYRMTVAADPAARWLVLDDAANRGWRATIDGRDLGPARRLDGGAAAWVLPPGIVGVVHARWTPQRWADAALGASVSAAAACVVALVAGVVRRRGRHRRAITDGGRHPAPSGLYEALAGLDRRTRPLRRPSAAATTGAAAAAGTAIALFVHPAYGALAAVVVAAGWRRPGRLELRLSGPAALVAGGLYVVVRQVVSRPVAGFSWPLAVNAAHRPVLAGILLAAVAVSPDAQFRRRSP